MSHIKILIKQCDYYTGVPNEMCDMLHVFGLHMSFPHCNWTPCACHLVYVIAFVINCQFLVEECS